MARNEVCISGFGGQGIILAGHIMGEAASKFDKKSAVLTKSYGPESRGGACAARLVISDSDVHYPYLTQPNLLVAMSQEAYDKYASKVPADGLIIIDETLVDPEVVPHRAPVLRMPATKVAEELGNRIVANVVMLGFVAGATDVVSAEAMRKAVLETVPKKALELNRKAFDTGLEYAKKAVEITGSR